MPPALAAHEEADKANHKRHPGDYRAPAFGTQAPARNAWLESDATAPVRERACLARPARARGPATLPPVVLETGSANGCDAAPSIQARPMLARIFVGQTSANPRILRPFVPALFKTKFLKNDHTTFPAAKAYSSTT